MCKVLLNVICKKNPTFSPFDPNTPHKLRKENQTCNLSLNENRINVRVV